MVVSDAVIRTLSSQELIVAYPTILLGLRKVKALTLLPTFVAPLSIIGSALIIYRILKFDWYDPNCANRRVYHRLLLGLSICDVVAAIAVTPGGLPMPKESGLWSAHGTTATCTAQGLFIQVFTGNVLCYNAGLMIYFLFTIRYNWSDDFFAQKLEWIIHILSNTTPLVGGVTSLFYKAFNPIGFGNLCHIAPYPPLCGGSSYPCTRGQHADSLFLAIVIIPQCVLVVILFASVFLIFLAVRSQAHRALQYAANRASILSHTKAVAMQSVWFGIVFFTTYVFGLLPFILIRIIKNDPQLLITLYVFCVLAVIFFPMQGLLNCILYLRPRIKRLKRERNLSVWNATMLAAFGGRETFRPISMNRRRSTLRTSPAAKSTRCCPQSPFSTQQTASSSLLTMVQGASQSNPAGDFPVEKRNCVELEQVESNDDLENDFRGSKKETEDQHDILSSARAHQDLLASKAVHCGVAPNVV